MILEGKNKTIEESVKKKDKLKSNDRTKIKQLLKKTEAEHGRLIFLPQNERRRFEASYHSYLIRRGIRQGK